VNSSKGNYEVSSLLNTISSFNYDPSDKIASNKLKYYRTMYTNFYNYHLLIDRALHHLGKANLTRVNVSSVDTSARKFLNETVETKSSKYFVEGNVKYLPLLTMPSLDKYLGTPLDYQMYFQQPATKIMQGIIDLHDDILFYLTMTTIVVV
jgi:hypothetical protein